MRQDILEELRNRGIDHEVMDHRLKDKNYDEEFLYSFKKKIKDNFKVVFSVNYYPIIAQACYDLGIKYISWSFDCPLDVRNIEETLGYPTNYVFLFDAMQAQK